MKLYIPIVSSLKPYIKDGKLQQKPSFTLLSLKNLKLLLEQLPSNKDMVEHLIAQRHIVKSGGRFSSIKINVTDELFEKLVSEIRRKVNCKHHNFQTIDIVVNLQSLPLIQVLKNKN